MILLTTVGVLGIGWTLSEFAKRYSGSGTVYEFIAHSLGKRAAAFSAGVYHLAAIALAGPGIAIIGGLWAKTFFNDHMGLDLEWWVWALVISALMFGANVMGVRISVKAQLVLIVLSVIPFLILAVKVIADGGPNGNSLDSFNPSNVAEGGSVFKGLLFAILMFIGFELAAALGEETKDPKRSIPKAVVATILIVGAFYLITQYTLAIGATDTATDFVPMAELYLNHFFAVWIDLAILLDILAVGIGFQLAAARGLFTLARDGLLPEAARQAQQPVVAGDRQLRDPGHHGRLDDHRPDEVRNRPDRPDRSRRVLQHRGVQRVPDRIAHRWFPDQHRVRAALRRRTQGTSRRRSRSISSPPSSVWRPSSWRSTRSSGRRPRLSARSCGVATSR